MRLRFKHLVIALLAIAVVTSTAACAGGERETTADGRQQIKVA